MPSSIIYDAYLDNTAKGKINTASDTFKCMLVNGYTPNKETHANRSDVTSEVTGTGYTSGGQACTLTTTESTTNDQEQIAFGNETWANSTITSTGAVIYKSTGNASADPLVAYVDFGGQVSSTNAAFSVAFSTPLIFQN